MTRIDVRVEGLDELDAGTKILAGKIENAAEVEFTRVASDVAGVLRGRLPRRTGRLAASARGQRSGLGSAMVEMGEGVAYAEFVEYGGRGFPHSPTGNYLYPTAEASEPLLVAAGNKAAEREIGAMSWPKP